MEACPTWSSHTPAVFWSVRCSAFISFTNGKCSNNYKWKDTSNAFLAGVILSRTNGGRSSIFIRQCRTSQILKSRGDRCQTNFTTKCTGITSNILVTHYSHLLNLFQSLSEPNNYHEFCRLLARLKTNYQLGELVMVDHYRDVIQLIAKFTVESLQVVSF